TRWTTLPADLDALTFSVEPAVLGSGYVILDSGGGLQSRLTGGSTLVPVPVDTLPDDLRTQVTTNAAVLLAYRFHGTPYTLPLQVGAADPESSMVTLDRFQLLGDLGSNQAEFTLSATAKVKNPRGGSLELLSGGVAMQEWTATDGWRLRFEDGKFWADFEKPGEYPVRLRFGAGVVVSNGWSRVRFDIASAALAPVRLRGLAEGTEVEFRDAARPERTQREYASHLPAHGRVQLGWRPAVPETEGRLFYSAEVATLVSVSPGLLRQTSHLQVKVMQGELSAMTLDLEGEGEITRVLGPQVLAWSVDPGTAGGSRRLMVRFNQPQRDRTTVQVQWQRPLGAFPQTFSILRIQPVEAARLNGWVRIVNEGAVRLEVVEALGLSQISPEQFEPADVPRDLLTTQATQVFAYRFSGAGHRLRVQADNILPELAVSEVLVYRLGESELSIDAEFEIEVREAPLRDLTVSLPKGYSVARVQAAGLADYFVSETAGDALAKVRLVYTAPVQGRQVVSMRLERNQSFTGDRWVLPRLDVDKAKSVRGHVGVAVEAGFRVTPGVTSGLTEVSTAFFPKKLAGLQYALRISEPNWEVTLGVERLAQSIQADTFHLFSVGEGIAYGSSLINYAVSGAPVGLLRIELSGEYFNVEFTGKNIRGWQKTERGYEVQLHSPVSGGYALLATYERPFKTSGETLTFTGARPLDAQSEQGYSLAVSTYQFQVQPVNVSGSLTALESGEVPAEYRLFFDAPILAAYRYLSRPFNLQLALTPLAQGAMVSQVVDRAALSTRISEEGQVVTEARYFVKNKGVPHLRLRLPEGSELWSVVVDGKPVVPVKDATSNLIPLPGRADPEVVMEVVVKMASKAANAGRLTVHAPIVAAPVLLAEWRLDPADGRRLMFRGGTLAPAGENADPTGFGAVGRLLHAEHRRQAGGFLALMGAGMMLMVWVWSGIRSGGGRRFGLRHGLAGAMGAAALVAAIAGFMGLRQMVEGTAAYAEPGLRFVAPIQQADAEWTLRLANVTRDASGMSWVSWLLALGMAGTIWVASWLTERSWLRRTGVAFGWTVLFFAALQAEQGGTVFVDLWMVLLVLRLVLPAWIRWWQGTPMPTATGATPSTSAAMATWLVAGFLMGAVGLETEARAQASTSWKPADSEHSLPELVSHEVEVRDDAIRGTATVRWVARKGQVLPLLIEPGILTRSGHPTNAARWVTLRRDGRSVRALVAESDQTLEFALDYQTRVAQRGMDRGLALPVTPGLVHRARLTLIGLDVEVFSPQAIGVRRETSGSNTVANLVLAPTPEPWVSWRPRTRDTRGEKPVYFAEWTHGFVPGPGVVEGLHELQWRPAQGEVEEMQFTVPAGVTITDVTAVGLGQWRFDPDARRLRVQWTSAQAKSLTLRIRSQVTAGALPAELSVEVPQLIGASGQVGLVGVATGAEVQLDEARAEGYAAINLEDFPTAVLEPFRALTTGLTVRRAFRYSDPTGRLTLKASAVEPDVRVESSQTLSLGEDRTVLAVQWNVEILRAGIFRMSFILPTGLDVESVSGPALSHWTELKSDGTRIVTLHLRGKTTGSQDLNLTLAGPGVRSTNGWVVPRLALREATKHRGQLMVVPEQGLRLQTVERNSVTPLDPAQLGVRQKGVLAFRLLQDPWSVTLNLERVDAWVQVTSLQHATFADAQVKVVGNLQYEIENTGVKALMVALPATAENVRFTGEQVSDFVAATATGPGGVRDWDVKLGRRMLGRYVLQVTYTLPVVAGADQAVLDGIQARGVNLQRGFVTLQAGGRLQVRAEATDALSATDWQVIPRALQQGLEAVAASHAFRMTDPAFRLPVRLERHEATRLLPARVKSVGLTTVVSDEGVALTQVRLQMVPGDKRLLHLTLPAGSRFWFAFVNQGSVWPWQSTNQILLPIDQTARRGEDTTVEFYYSGKVGNGGRRTLDLDLMAPRLDLPLEDIQWAVYLGERWALSDWGGALQLKDPGMEVVPVAVDLQTYVQKESQSRQEKTREAEQFLNLANSLLAQGDPQEARRAFQQAYGLSQHDQAFNEDARVQLNNLRTQQALVGLNFRDARVMGEGAGGGGATAGAPAPRGLLENRAPTYTQEEARQWLDRKGADENAAQARLAERIIQQQDAALASPAAIRAAIPEQGRKFLFTRPLEVNPWAELRLNIEAKSTADVSWGMRWGLVLGVFLLALVFLAVGRWGRRSEA
ncbi:MAG: tetratricopeptide repeat protein, partial [Verrucomicrobiales bacterium]|nr:tetratricopeptide repeat protein [Verrucomicrobiales bacterium]